MFTARIPPLTQRQSTVLRAVKEAIPHADIYVTTSLAPESLHEDHEAVTVSAAGVAIAHGEIDTSSDGAMRNSVESLKADAEAYIKTLFTRNETESSSRHDQ